MIDLHSHILPGVDDGARDFEDSLNILEGLARQGITDIVLTPHYVAETSYISTRSKNLAIFEELKKKVKRAKLGINLYLANEIYIDQKIEKYLKNKKIATINDTKNLLIELPMSGEFESYEDIILSLQNKGYTVILAHPERYRSTQKDFKILERLHENGVLLQANLGSIIEQYGKHAKKTVKKLIKKDMVYCFGTDIHHARDYNEIEKAQNKIAKIIGDKKLKQLLVKNPQKLLQAQ